jgi:hypothetical protein
VSSTPYHSRRGRQVPTEIDHHDEHDATSGADELVLGARGGLVVEAPEGVALGAVDRAAPNELGAGAALRDFPPAAPDSHRRPDSKCCV